MPSNAASMPEEFNAQAPLGLKHPLQPIQPLGQTWLSPKFLTPLGAKPLAVLDPTVFAAESFSDYTPPDRDFQASPFFPDAPQIRPPATRTSETTSATIQRSTARSPSSPAQPSAPQPRPDPASSPVPPSLSTLQTFVPPTIAYFEAELPAAEVTPTPPPTPPSVSQPSTVQRRADLPTPPARSIAPTRNDTSSPVTSGAIDLPTAPTPAASTQPQPTTPVPDAAVAPTTPAATPPSAAQPTPTLQPRLDAAATAPPETSATAEPVAQSPTSDLPFTTVHPVEELPVSSPGSPASESPPALPIQTKAESSRPGPAIPQRDSVTPLPQPTQSTPAPASSPAAPELSARQAPAEIPVAPVEAAIASTADAISTSTPTSTPNASTATPPALPTIQPRLESDFTTEVKSETPLENPIESTKAAASEAELKSGLETTSATPLESNLTPHPDSTPQVNFSASTPESIAKATPSTQFSTPSIQPSRAAAIAPEIQTEFSSTQSSETTSDSRSNRFSAPSPLTPTTNPRIQARSNQDSVEETNVLEVQETKQLTEAFKESDTSDLSAIANSETTNQTTSDSSTSPSIQRQSETEIEANETSNISSLDITFPVQRKAEIPASAEIASPEITNTVVNKHPDTDVAITETAISPSIQDASDTETRSQTTSPITPDLAVNSTASSDAAIVPPIQRRPDAPGQPDIASPVITNAAVNDTPIAPSVQRRSETITQESQMPEAQESAIEDRLSTPTTPVAVEAASSPDLPPAPAPSRDAAASNFQPANPLNPESELSSGAAIAPSPITHPPTAASSPSPTIQARQDPFASLPTPRLQDETPDEATTPAQPPVEFSESPSPPASRSASPPEVQRVVQQAIDSAPATPTLQPRLDAAAPVSSAANSPTTPPIAPVPASLNESTQAATSDVAPTISAAQTPSPTEFPTLPTVLTSLSTLNSLGASHPLTQASKFLSPTSDSAVQRTVEDMSGGMDAEIMGTSSQAEPHSIDRSPLPMPIVQTKPETAGGAAIAPSQSSSALPTVSVPSLDSDYTLPALTSARAASSPASRGDRGNSSSIASGSASAFGQVSSSSGDAWSSIEELLNLSQTPDASSLIQRFVDSEPAIETAAESASTAHSSFPTTRSALLDLTDPFTSQDAAHGQEHGSPGSAHAVGSEAVTEVAQRSQVKNESDSLEILAREIYGLLRQRLEIERERQGGYYSNRLF